MEFSPRQCSQLLDIARGIIRQTLSGVRVVYPECHDLDFFQPAGCFVTLHSHDKRLRGCIGRLDANEALFTTVCNMAAAVLTDHRFKNQPVTLAELSALEIDISVLSPLRPAPTPLAFDPGTHGIYLSVGRRGGTFLPQVARETGWGREQLLERLCTEKLGVPPDSWRRPEARLSIFDAIMIGPEPFERPVAAKQLSAVEV